MKLWPYIFAIAAAQGFILSLALYRKKVNPHSNKILSLWIFLLSFDLILKSIYLNDPKTSLLSAYTFIQFFPYLYGSFFFLYAKTLTQNHQLIVKDLIHFAGFIVMASINIQWILNPWENGPKYEFIYEPSLYLYSVSYVIAGLVMIRRYRNNLNQQQSNTDGIDLGWIYLTAYSQIIIWLVAITQWLTPIKGYNHWVIYLFISIWIILLGYLGLSQQTIEPVQSLVEPSPSNVDESRFEEVDQRLKTLMNQNQLFLEPSLNIGQLAKSSGYPEYLISLVINRMYHTTFREYINSLRVSHAQNLLKNSSTKKTILDIAYDCGFVSKSTFNSAFKRILNETPSAFRQRHLD
jgi:AraC-like DNA-binding protein